MSGPIVDRREERFDERDRSTALLATLVAEGASLSTTPQYILGISAFYHDSAAALLRDGEIVAAAQEERFTRQKGDASFPEHAKIGRAHV